MIEIYVEFMLTELIFSIWFFKVKITNSNRSLQLDMMAQMLARRAEDREVPGSSPARD